MSAAATRARMAATGARGSGAVTGARGSVPATGARGGVAATGAFGLLVAPKYVTCWDSALLALAVSPRGTAVSVCFDTRADLGYSRSLGNLRKAWACSHRRGRGSEIPAHVHIELIGSESAPSCLGQWHFFWAKVWLVRELLKHPNVGWVLWLDSDAAPVPTMPCRGGLQFLALDVLVKSALSRTQPQAHFQPPVRSALSRAQPPAQVQPPATFNQFAFLGYREKGNKATKFKAMMNAGVFIVRNGGLATRLFDMWWRRRRLATWTPSGRIGDCPGCEQTEFEIMLKCRAKCQPRSATGDTVKRRPAARRPTSDGTVRRKPATHQPQAFRSTDVVGRGVFLAPEVVFCEQGRGPVGSTPFVHFYGNSQWIGKSQIGNWLRDFIEAIPETAREEFPAVLAQLHNKRPRSRDEPASRRRNVAAIRKHFGKTVQYKGKRYPSLRAASEATGKSRQFLREL